MEAGALHAPAGLGRRPVGGPLLRLRSDEQLVALFRAGHDEAFRVIHDRYRVRLFAYARQMLSGSRAEAEDALQDVFLRAYYALRADDRPVTLRAWLYRVAHNRCVDVLRRPVPLPAEVFELQRSPLPDPLAECERREDLRRLVADIRRLPEAQRSALLMREMEGLSYLELGAALDVSVPAVKSLLVRARVGLAEAIEARGAACPQVRSAISASVEERERLSGPMRRHVRECDGCSAFRDDLRSARRALAGVVPSPGPFGLLAKLVGGGGAAAGGGAALGGGTTAVVGTGAAAKIAAVVCCAAVVGGSAAEVSRHTAGAPAGKAKPTASTPVAPRVATAAAAAVALHLPDPAPAVRPAERRAAADKPAASAVVHDEAVVLPALPVHDGPAGEVARSAGGVLAPDEPVDEVPAVSGPAPVAEETPAAPAATPVATEEADAANAEAPAPPPAG